MRKILFVITLLSSFALTHAQPQTTTKISFTGLRHTTGWLPFEFYNNSQIYVPVSIEGHKVKALLANSVLPARIDKNFAVSIGINGNPGQKTTVDITIANLVLKSVPTVIAPPKTTGHPRDFVLGDDVFQGLTVDIDFAHHRIAFIDTSEFRRPAGYLPLPLVTVEDSRAVPVAIEGGVPQKFDVYLGDPAPVSVYEACVAAQGLLKNKPASIRLGGGVGTHPKEGVASLQYVQFGGMEFRVVPGVFPSDSVRGSTSTAVAGHIGLGLLSRFHVIFDYLHDLLYVNPYAGAVSTAFPKDRSGLFLIESQGVYTVEFVAPESPAEKAGFKTGDTIRNIDQKPVTAYQGQAWQTAALATLRSTSPGTTFIFTLSDGQKRELHTQDYF